MARVRLLLLAVALSGCGYPELTFVPDVSDVTVDDVAAVEDTVADAPPVEASNLVDAASVDTAPDVACQAGYSRVGGACVAPTSCRAIRDAFPTADSGAYTIDPDGEGGEAPFAVYCELREDGGGWTLAMKLDGGESTFAYDSPYWTDDAVLNPTSTDLSQTEAKFRAFSTLPLTQLRIGMSEDGTRRFVVVDLPRPSLRSAFSGGRLALTAGRAAWLELLSSPQLQPNCNAEGINQQFVSGGKIRTRIGIVGNDQFDCLTPNSFIGFGASLGGPSAWCDASATTTPHVVVGNFARTACAGVKYDRVTVAFGYVFVR